MALPLGICGDVGLAGLTLGGGYGYLMGVAGLACDSLVGVQIVMADSSIRTVTDDSDKDLMWALRGGGANFGIVTQLHFKPFRIGDICGGSHAGGDRLDGTKLGARVSVHPRNMLGDESPGRVREAYGENYWRLSTLKVKYDPSNVFRLNQNEACPWGRRISRS
jgi:hypothetical protein